MTAQVLLHVPTFPDAVPERVLESAINLTHLVGAHLTADIGQLNNDRATWPLVIGSYPLDFPQLMDELVVKSEANAAASVKCLTDLCAEYGVVLDLRRRLTTSYTTPASLVDLARLHDLVILPVPECDALGRSCVQAMLFGSGRPVVLLPSHRKPLRWLDRVVVAWDWSREASRALFHSLPFLPLAKEVKVVTVFGEKHIETSSFRADLERLLESHNVKYSLSQIDLERRSIGEVLMRHSEDVGADLLVMGAYGHGRMSEFILGGATYEVLRDPVLPVLLSH